MDNDKDLKKFENKAFQVAFMDGLIDMLFGFIWVGFGISTFLYDYIPSPLNSFLGLIITLIAATVYLILKFVVAQPRLGVVKLSGNQKERSKKLFIFNIIAVIVTLFIVIFTVMIPNSVFFAFLGSLGFGTAIFFGLIPVVIMSIVAFAFNYNRFYVYGAIMGLALFMNELLRILNVPISGITLLIGGICIMSVGIFLFIQFIRKNPLPTGDEYAQHK